MEKQTKLQQHLQALCTQNLLFGSCNTGLSRKTALTVDIKHRDAKKYQCL